MTLLQSTLEEINDSEHSLLATAKDRYGDFYSHARGASVYLSLCITAIDPDRMMFARLFSQLKKHQFLALISVVRLHQVQAMMNLRQVLEAGASAAFALVHTELHHFAHQDEFGILDPAQALTKKRYAWLEANYPNWSDWIRDEKDKINNVAAHSNIVTADHTFSLSLADERVDVPFFDIEDDHFVKVALWQCANVALTIARMLAAVNQKSRCVAFRDDFNEVVASYTRKTEALRAAITNTERFKAALQVQKKRTARKV